MKKIEGIAQSILEKISFQEYALKVEKVDYGDIVESTQDHP